MADNSQGKSEANQWLSEGETPGTEERHPELKGVRMSSCPCKVRMSTTKGTDELRVMVRRVFAISIPALGFSTACDAMHTYILE